MNNSRIKYTLTASVEKPNVNFDLFCKTVSAEVSKLTGGCFTTFGKGYWTDEAIESKDVYSNLVREAAFRLEVTSETDIHDKLQAIYAKAKRIAKVDVVWVDCNTQEVTAKHFEI